MKYQDVKDQVGNPRELLELAQQMRSNDPLEAADAEEMVAFMDMSFMDIVNLINELESKRQ